MNEPDPVFVAIVTGLLRHVLTLLSGVGLVTGTYSDSLITIVASSLVGIAMASWSLIQKVQARRASRASSIASARISAEQGEPIVVNSQVPA